MTPPERPAVVLDMDWGNEIDDQFALVWALQAEDRLDIRALHAAPWSFSKALYEGGGLLTELDYREYDRLLDELGLNTDILPTITPEEGVLEAVETGTEIVALAGLDLTVVEGSRAFLPDRQTPVDSPTIASLRAVADEEPERVYVVATGALTNVASALLADPQLADEIVVVWVATYPTFWPEPNPSFNLVQDVAAAQVVFESEVPLVYVPGYYVAEELRVSQPEIEAWVRPHGAVGEHLAEIYDDHPLIGGHFGQSKVLWDMGAVAWIWNPESTNSKLGFRPTIDDERRWTEPQGAPFLEVVDLDRDAAMTDFYTRLAEAAEDGR